MKTKITLFFFVLFGIDLWATDIIPNASFENWTGTSYVTPTNYDYTSNSDVYYYDQSLNVEKTTDAYSGQYAVKLTTISTSWGSSIAYFLNTDPEEGDMAKWTNGFPYNEIPTRIRGYYKYNQTTADSALIMIVFRKAGSSIGNYIIKIGGVHNTYTLFDVPLQPALTQTPDSIVFGAVSSDFSVHESGVVGSVLYLDSVSLKGVNSQPALFNGDFENWSTHQLPITIDDWNPRKKHQDGVARTTDAKDGNYAIELTSVSEDDNGDGVFNNNPGYLTNGYWDDNCGCNKGGIPFTHQIDTLTFWYKYSATTYASTVDHAQVNLQFKKNGSFFNGASRQLDATTEYEYVEVPFYNDQIPDSVIIDFVSSLWDNKNVAFIGSKLIIDKLQFKSEIIYLGTRNTTIPSAVDIYPSVSNAIFKFSNPNELPLQVEVYNSIGTKIIRLSVTGNEMNLGSLPTGIYFIKIRANDDWITKRILKQ
jgi:hypothetical protein